MPLDTNRNTRAQQLGNVRDKWASMADVRPGDVKLGDGVDFFLHLTEDKASLRAGRSSQVMSPTGTVLQPGGRLSVQAHHGNVDFNGKAINPLATEGSSAALLVPTVTQKSPAEYESLDMLVGMIETVESVLAIFEEGEG